MKLHFVFYALLLGLISISCQKKDPAPIASFTYTADGYVASFTSNSKNNPSTLTWDFGDGTPTATGATVTHTYATSGTYNVQLTASGSNGSNTSKMDAVLKEQVVQINTIFGDIFIWLYNETPNHKANYLKLAKSQFYTGTTFHRIIPNFVIQGGDSLSKDNDPTNDGSGGPSTIYPEISSSILHDYGAVGAARNNNPQKISNNWQFYIVTNKAGDHNLDGLYTVFGTVMLGRDVADKIASQPRDANDRPLTDIRMTVNVLDKTKAEIQAEYGYTVK
jgi:cyclophilin family peptidyl-prolyl cis-trans isomerase